MNCYISYATANDDVLFTIDRLHFHRMAIYDSGVDKTQIFIAVSEVNPRTEENEKIISEALRKLQSRSSGRIEIKNLEYKSNLGRDFSSHALNLRRIANEAQNGDSVLFLNRSAYGPLKKNWYLMFLNQIERFPHVAICGSTINFLGYSKINTENICQTHVQSYAFLSKFPFLNCLVDKFPGENFQERSDVIKYGEIGLSQKVFYENYGITSLVWPEYYFTKENISDANLPHKDIKKKICWVKDLPFRHKFKGYRGLPYSLIQHFSGSMESVQNKLKIL